MASLSAPPHPGAVLILRFLVPRRIRQSQFAEAVGMHGSNLNTFINGRRSLTPRMAWAFATVLRTRPEYWASLQMRYDLWQARPRRAGPKPSRRRRR